MRSALATLLTLVVLGTLLWLGARHERPVSSDSSEATAKARVWSMLEAAEKGDVAAYLDCFADELRRSLETSVRELGEQSFAEWLRAGFAELSGVAIVSTESTESTVSPVSAASALENGPTEARQQVTVEYVYASESEEQEVSLNRFPGVGWRITAVSRSERRRSLIPYGTPIEPWQ